MKIIRLLVAAQAALGFGLSHAADWTPAAVFVETGITVHEGYHATAGAAWPWAWQRLGRGGEWTGRTEVFASRWSAKARGERESLIQLGVIPLLRLRFDQGRSDWFAEAGIGASYMNRRYRRDSEEFSTRFNFVDTVAVGLSLGARREHEVSLRVTHVSNAGIKNPNPGENFLQLRYAHSY